MLDNCAGMTEMAMFLRIVIFGFFVTFSVWKRQHRIWSCRYVGEDALSEWQNNCASEPSNACTVAYTWNMPLENLSTTRGQIRYLSRLEHDIFLQQLWAVNATLFHLNDTLVREIYHPIENRSRRALVDISGELLQGIFDIATDNKSFMDIPKEGHNCNKCAQKIIHETVSHNNRPKQNVDIVLEKNDFVIRVMNTICIEVELMSSINILLTEYNNIVNSLRKGLLPTNMVTREIWQKIISEGSKKFAWTKFPGNGKRI